MGNHQPRACLHCGKFFEKPYNVSQYLWEIGGRKFCSYNCKAESQRGKPSGKTGWRKPEEQLSQNWIPCRICGGPTRYHGNKNSPHAGLVRCSKQECIEESKRLKNEKIKQTHEADYASGKRRKLHDGWNKISRVSKEEKLLEPWFTKHGWKPQFPYSKYPDHGTYIFDFAMPSHKLYIEIDGSSHKHEPKQHRDAQKDKLMHERGWHVLRIPADAVSEGTLEEMIEIIRDWATNFGHTSCAT